MMEVRGRWQSIDDRLKLYDNILSEHPHVLEAVYQTEQTLDTEVDTSIYLRTMVPVLLEFTEWVMKEAVYSGKKRLYFLSRDGYQMYKAACTLTKQKNMPLECRYLYVSRYSMRVPSYQLDLENCLDLICVGGVDVTLEKILRRAALTAEEAEEVIAEIGWQPRQREILNYRQILELKEILKKHEKLFTYIEKHSKDSYENAMGYLEQEGLLSDTSYAIVDSGWVGTLQLTLEMLIHSRKPDIQVEGYYFGLYELPPGMDGKRAHGWYFAPERGLGRKVYFSNSLFETICSADEGMTLGYSESNGRFLPELDPRGNPNGEQLRKNQRALEKFLEVYSGSLRILKVYSDFWGHGNTIFLKKTGGEKGLRCPRPCEKDGGKLALRIFKSFMAVPGQLEVETYGNNFFSDDMLEGSLKKVAAELTERQIREQRFLGRLLILCGAGKTAIHESSWIEGSIARLEGRKQGKYWRHARFYKYVLYVRKQISAVIKKSSSAKNSF